MYKILALTRAEWNRRHSYWCFFLSAAGVLKLKNDQPLRHSRTDLFMPFSRETDYRPLTKLVLSET